MARAAGVPAVAVALFIGSVALTVVWCGSMSGGMPMPGGWTMSMAWMRMPGQSWLLASASFLGMWAVMMVAMMSPALVSMLAGYRVAPAAEPRIAAAACGYFLIWTLPGALLYPLGILVASVAMRSPLVARGFPVAGGMALLLAGWIQLTAWKARRLARCRPSCPPAATLAGAFRHGIRLGLNCVLCCAGFMIALLVLGVMDLRVMAAVTAGITVERFAVNPERAAQIAGVILLGAGIVGLVRVA